MISLVVGDEDGLERFGGSEGIILVHRTAVEN